MKQNFRLLLLILLCAVTSGAWGTDVATLPFEFDGGKDDIEDTPGLTQNGLGSDFSSSPKLNFNSEEDELILHFDERPGKLTYDIKGYGWDAESPEGNFVVMVSTDGVNYTELTSDTYVGSNVIHNTFRNLNEDVRYIKWVFEFQFVGTVALGNIKLEKYTGPVPDVATLPFEFDGGRDDIEDTPGLTQNGLGTDSSSSPKLNFNSAEDELILHFDERPGKFSYDIKAGGWDPESPIGEFYVFVSKDGENYTRLRDYNYNTNGVEHETFNNLDEDVKYIKWEMPDNFLWAYIGNIKLEKYSEPTDNAYCEVSVVVPGKYLIVNENGGAAFDGSLETLDAAGNDLDITIDGYSIGGNTIIDAAIFTIEVIDEEEKTVTIKSASGKYIGRTIDADGIETSDETPFTNTITFDTDGTANIVSGGAYLRFNSASGQSGFRYYESSSYTNQSAIKLYRLLEPVTVDISPVGYATFYYGKKDFYVPKGVRAKMYRLNENKELTEITPYIEGGSGVIPRGHAVVLEATTKSNETQSFVFREYNSYLSSPTINNEWSQNILRGSDKETSTDEIVSGDYLYYMLSVDKNNENVGFYWGASHGGAFMNGAHKAFLAIEKSSGVNASSFVFDDLTGIPAITSDTMENTEDVYTLSGIRIDGKNLPKGIYIINGKKVVIK